MLRRAEPRHRVPVSIGVELPPLPFVLERLSVGPVEAAGAQRVGQVDEVPAVVVAEIEHRGGFGIASCRVGAVGDRHHGESAGYESAQCCYDDIS